MKFKSTLLSILTLVFAGLISSANAQDAMTILKKMDATAAAIKDKSVSMKMVMVNLKSKKEESKEAELLQKGMNMKLFRYTAPPSDAGIATLSLPNNEIYVYLPMFKKPKKITNLAESGAFNKSDFSLEDMATQAYSDKYTPTLLSTNATQYVLELKPKDPKSPYSRLVISINKTTYCAEQIEYFDSKNNAVKKANYHYKKVSNLWVADEVSMEDLKKQHKTTLYMSNVKLNQGLKDELFTLENLVPKE